MSRQQEEQSRYVISSLWRDGRVEIERDWVGVAGRCGLFRLGLEYAHLVYTWLYVSQVPSTH